MFNNLSSLKNKWGELLAFGVILGVLIAGCGGGGESSSAGFTQSYTSSAGAGDVLQFSVNTANMTYSFQVKETSYAASGVSATESSTGTLTGRNAVGSYNVSASADGFILGGEVFAMQNGLFVGHVIISPIGGSTIKIPVFGVPTPITAIANLAGTYNYQGFGCAGLSGGNVLGAIPCASHTGTITVTSAGAFTTCKGGNLGAASPVCASQATGSIVATATPGVYDFQTTGGTHRGWFFAFTSGGQNVAVIDHDDAVTPFYGHSVALTQATLTSGQVDGNYFVKNNIGGRDLITVGGNAYTDINAAGTTTGTLAYNIPWTGLVTYNNNITGASGVADIATVGAFTYTSNSITYLHGVGLKY